MVGRLLGNHLPPWYSSHCMTDWRRMKQNVPMVGASEAPQGSVLLSFNDPRLRHRQPTSLSIFHVLCPPSGTLARGSPFTGTTSTQLLLGVAVVFFLYYSGRDLLALKFSDLFMEIISIVLSTRFSSAWMSLSVTGRRK
jgi:hypothetical protein